MDIRTSTHWRGRAVVDDDTLDRGRRGAGVPGRDCDPRGRIAVPRPRPAIGLARGERRRPLPTTTKALAPASRKRRATATTTRGWRASWRRWSSRRRPPVRARRPASSPFSGGVDSSLVAHVVHRAFGAGDDDDDRSDVPCSSPRSASSFSSADHCPDRARRRPTHRNPLWELRTNEGDVPEYVANDGESCAHCKNTLYSTLRAVAAAAAAADAERLHPTWLHPPSHTWSCTTAQTRTTSRTRRGSASSPRRTTAWSLPRATWTKRECGV